MDERLLSKFLKLRQPHDAVYTPLSYDPVILLLNLTLDLKDDFLSKYASLFSALRGRRIYCLCGYTWAVTPKIFEWVHQLEATCKREFPAVQLIHLCNEKPQVENVKARGGQAIFCSHNCFVDESVFAPIRSIEKKYDALYNARLVRWKRHELALDIASLALIYYPIAGDDQAHLSNIRRRFSHAHFFNHPDAGAYRLLSPREANRCLNACRVGLCLSEQEGAMYASAEYLLSGLPVVSTPNTGGRDVFFEDSFAMTVSPEPGAIAAGVRELISRDLNPDEIRRPTLEKIGAHRRRLISRVQEIYDLNGVGRRFADEWSHIFFHKMLQGRKHLDTITEVQRAETAARPLPPDGG